MEYSPASTLEVDTDSLEPQTLTVMQAARQASVTQSAIIRWIRNGYLPATPSASGWQIPSDKLDAAQAAADDSRGAGAVPRQVGPRLMPAPEELRRTLAMQAVDQPVRLDVLSETIVTPLVELIRDQTDVVHDQAEVIGWLQCERSRLNAQLAELIEIRDASQTEEIDPPDKVADEADDTNVDEVVSWLWDDSALPNETIRSIGREHERDLTTPFGPDVPLVFVTSAAESTHGRADSASATPVAGPTSLDDSWFVLSNSDATESFGSLDGMSVPRLRPIVARREIDNPHAGTQVAGDDLGQIIDETERRIAEMWRHEAQLSSTRGGALSGQVNIDEADQEQAPFWQRVWPLNRRIS